MKCALAIASGKIKLIHSEKISSELKKVCTYVPYKTVINALTNALDELTDEKLRAYKMVANVESQREVAEELGISRRTLRDRKDSAMKELGDKLKDYK